jgi:hypothetical protein
VKEKVIKQLAEAASELPQPAVLSEKETVLLRLMPERVAVAFPPLIMPTWKVVVWPA